MTAMPSSPATRRMVTASRPSASAIRTATAVMAARSCRGLGPRVPCSGRSQTDPGAARAARAGRPPGRPAALAGGSPADVITRHPTFHRAAYVVSSKQRTLHVENSGTAACPRLTRRQAGQRMKTMSATIQIGAPPEAVWAVLTDLGRYPDWNPLFREASGQVAVGSRITLRSVHPANGRLMTIKPRLTVV